MNNKLIGSFVVILILVGGGAFYGGMQYGKNQASAVSAGVLSGNRTRTGAAGRFGGGTGGAVSGQVLGINNNMLTIKLRDGSSRIVLYSSSTAISKQAAGALSDISAGSDLMVFGTTNSDGSVTASNIQIRPPTSTRPF